jgi:hypothetical protein
MAYFAHLQSQINYGIIVWGSSSPMRNVFIIQKRAIRIMMRLGPRSSCREGLKKLDTLTVPCLYIYVLMLFLVKNPKIYQNNTSVHGRNIRQQNKLHVLSVRSSTIQRGVYYSFVKIFNYPPPNILNLHNNIPIFRTMLRNYLVKNAFYSIDEFPSKDFNS